MDKDMPFIKRVSFPGFIVGSIVDIVASNIWGVFAVFYILTTHHLPLTNPTELTSQILTLFRTDPVVFIGNMLIGGLCSVLGGYVGAWIAKHDEILNGALSSILCLATGFYSIATGAYTGNIFIALLSILVNPALCAFGGYLRWLWKYRNSTKTANA
jgi:hypothetical protein